MMRINLKTSASLLALAALLVFGTTEVNAQFTYQWLDIGQFQHRYRESGASAETDVGKDWPAELRYSANQRGQAFHIGVTDWVDERGDSYAFYVGQVGPRQPGVDLTYPIQNKVIARYEDTEVYVDGALSFEYVTVVDEVDPGIPADRMIDNIWNMRPGVTSNRKAYAYTNEFFDDFHIITWNHCNTGNIDDDDDIELPGQTLHGTMFFHMNRDRGNHQAADQVGNAQNWGKYSMVDIVGDGHAEYPVDFTATYIWHGRNPDFTRYDMLGAPIWEDDRSRVASGDSVGRLGGLSFVGQVTLHADTSPTDETYIKCTAETQDTCQPKSLFWLDTDETLASHSASHQDQYELGIFTRENPKYFPGGNTKGWPHYADRIEPTGNFWTGQNDASSGKQGGHAATFSYGPYEMAFGECVSTAEADVVNGMSYDAAVQIGRTWKRSGGNVDLQIAYDANKDGVINETPFNNGEDASTWVNNLNVGTERMTKNQWFMTNRDSLLKYMGRAVEVWEASNGMTQYVVPEPPRSPVTFEVFGRPDKIDLSWTPASGGPAITGWELWRTSKYDDNFLDADGDGIYKLEPNSYGGETLVTGYECIAGCEGTPALGPGATSFEDNTANRGQDYYYYLQAVGEAQSWDPTGLNGTPDGRALRSSRYLTQSFLPTNLKRPPYGTSGTVADARVVPNPVNLGSDESVRFSQEDRVAFFNIPGNCNIKIFTEIGELVHVIEHTDGSGDETWNLTTEARQLLVSGIYIAVIEDLDQGDTSTIKFTVIR